MLSCMIDAMEGWDIATADTPEYFLQNDYDKRDINIKMYGTIVIILKDIDLAYYKDFIYIDRRVRKCM